MAEETQTVTVQPEAPQDEVKELLEEGTDQGLETPEPEGTQPDQPSTETDNAEKAEEKPEETVEKEKKKKQSLDDRLKQLGTQTYEMRESERRNQAILDEIKKREQAQQPAQAPKEDDFDDFNKYTEAKIKYEVGVQTQAIQQKYAQDAQKAKYAEAQRKKDIDWNYKKEKAINADPDFGRHEFNVAQVLRRFNPSLATTITAAPEAVELVTHFANNLEQLEQIAQLPSDSAKYEIGKAGAQLTAKPVKKLTKAKDSIKPGGTGGGAPKNLNTMSQKEYNIYRNKQPY